MQLIELKNPDILPFRFKKIKNGKFFLSNDYGQRIILNPEDFYKFVQDEELEENIKDALYEKFFWTPQKEPLHKDLIKDLAGKRLVRNSYILQGPALHIIVVTLYCNHACKYCHASARTKDADKYHMSIEQAKKVVDVIFETTAGSITIEFQGGEPLANWDVVKYVIGYAREKNKEYNLDMDITIVSNLTLMDDEKLEYLVDNDISISTSLDGQKELHDYNRVYVNGSSFDSLAYRIPKINQKYIEKGSERRVGAIATATKKSLSYHKEIVDTFIDFGLDSIFIRPLNPFGMALKLWNEIGYSYEEYSVFYKKLLDYVDQKKAEGIRFKESFREIYLYNMQSPRKANYMEERSPCGAGLGQLAYNWDGKVYTCDEGRMIGTMGDDAFKVGEIDLNKEPKEIYQEIINSSVIKSMASASHLDSIPGYESNPFSAFIGSCPIYSYCQNQNIVSKYKREERFIHQQNLFEKILNDIVNEDKKIDL